MERLLKTLKTLTKETHMNFENQAEVSDQNKALRNINVEIDKIKQGLREEGYDSDNDSFPQMEDGNEEEDQFKELIRQRDKINESDQETINRWKDKK